ncbi:MAG: AAA family ATPase [Planctomycetota bacterium]
MAKSKAAKSGGALSPQAVSSQAVSPQAPSSQAASPQAASPKASGSKSGGSKSGGSRASGSRAALPLGPLVKSVVKLAYRARRPVLLEGPTGIGKSELIAQVAEELGVGYLVLDLSLLEPPDLVGLPVIENNRTSFASPLALPQEGAGILMLEELNRAERYIQQPALQLLTARRLHQYQLPDGWMTCAAINPEHDEYQVTPLDPALRSRFLNIAVRADRVEWLAWARDHSLHTAVLELAGEQDRFLEDVPPRTWTYVSQVLQAMGPAEIGEPRLLHAMLCGYLPTAWSEALAAKLESLVGRGGLDVGAMLRSYHEDAVLRKAVAELVSRGQTDALEMIWLRVHEVVSGPEIARLIGRSEFKLEAFERLLQDLPGDFRERLQDEFSRQLSALPLLHFRAEDAIARDYPGSPLSTRVRQLVADPSKRHRVKLIAFAVQRHLEQHPKVFELRRNNSAMLSLGVFLQHIEPHAGPLRELARKLELDVKTGK